MLSLSALSIFTLRTELRQAKALYLNLSKFSNIQTHQLSIFEDVKQVESNNELDKVLDKLKDIYGSNIIKKASQIKKDWIKIKKLV